MIDEGALRHRFPEIPWDQPVEVSVLKPSETIEPSGNFLVVTGSTGYLVFFVCRVCIALEGVSAQNLIRGNVPFAFKTREDCLDHIEEGHHE